MILKPLIGMIKLSMMYIEENGERSRNLGEKLGYKTLNKIFQKNIAKQKGTEKLLPKKRTKR